MTRFGTDGVLNGWPLGREELARPMALGLLDGVLPPYVGLSADRRVLFVSASAVEYLRAPASEPSGDLRDVLLPDFGPVIEPLLSAALAPGAQVQAPFEGHVAGQARRMTVIRVGLEDGQSLLVFRQAAEAGASALLRETVMAASPFGAVHLDAQMCLAAYTPAALSVFAFEDGDRGCALDEVDAQIDTGRLLMMARGVLETGAARTADFPMEGSDRVLEVRFEPVAEAGGVVLMMGEVTRLRALEAEIDKVSDLSRQRLSEIEALYDITPQAMGLIAPDLTYLRVNQRLARINGITVSAHLGKRLDQVVPDIGAEVIATARQVLQTGRRIENLRIEGRTAQRPDEDRIWETDWYPVRKANGTIIGVGVNVRDVTEQVEMAKDLRHVMQELQHRVQNMLANISVLIKRAARDATTDTDVIETLNARVRALAQTHSQLTQADWSSLPLTQLIEPELGAIYGADRVTLRGPEIDVSARAALALGLAIHELATNAAKYGAFAAAEGHVSFSWERRVEVEEDICVMSWVETGGAPPEEPASQGFGSELIAATIEGNLQGKVRLEWRPSGLVCVMMIPFALLTETPRDERFDRL